MPVCVAAITSKRARTRLAAAAHRQAVEMNTPITDSRSDNINRPSDSGTGDVNRPNGSSSSSSPPNSGSASPASSGRQTPQGIERSFKRRRDFESRKKDVEDIVKKHPTKVPIIIECGRSEKNLPLLDKSKFLVPEELTMSQLTTIIRRRLELKESQAFYLIVNRRTMVSSSTTLAEVYRSDKDADGFLYIAYASQEMFG